jgi:hypothetical protein
MRCTAIVTVPWFLIVGPVLLAQDEPQRGRVKGVDPVKGIITILADGRERTLEVTEKTIIRGGSGGGLKGIKEGADVMFKAGQSNGKAVLLGLMVRAPMNPAMPRSDTSKLKPLTELGSSEYQGSSGGLYPAGKNDRPQRHEAAGIALAAQLRPLDRQGKPSAGGRLVLLSVGMSNTTQEFSAFKRLADGDAAKNPALTLLDGAQGGMTAAAICKLDSGQGARYWDTVDQRLAQAGVSREQVQAAWIKEADAGPTQGFPAYARTLQAELRQIVQLMHTRFPNLKLVYLSSRTYGGFATTRLNPEPYAYESGFSVKWLIEEQLKGEAELNFDARTGPVRAPWLSWGPYLWANGSVKRADGFSYDESDFGGDGTHPTAAGQRKVARLLLEFFKTDSTTKPWFTRVQDR